MRPERPVINPGVARRKPLSVSPEELVETKLPEGKTLPLIVRPAVAALNLLDWAAGHTDFVEAKVLEHGGLLFRDFGVRSAAEFEQFIRITAGEPLEYRERSSPRSQVGAGNVYTSTDYPADQPIYLHNENSYQGKWPLRLFFYCETAARERGETPIADVRRVMARLDPSVVERFAEKQVMYVRNFGSGLGLPWQTVFQTEDRAVVEGHCRANGITFEWLPGDRLRTRAVRPALARHPRTGELTWFNHATFFHVTTREPKIRQALLAVFKEEDLPTNTYYGDGSPIEPEVLDGLRAAYEAELVALPWREGDVLLLDNMLAAHGRSPYSGPRKILVGMAVPVTERNL
ncbi:MAG: TauD/TfdA family dioxygenase [Acidobacteriota bacterium]|nr:TauD/TfdA family dioxygenase [Acidobacteriota bacterium]